MHATKLILENYGGFERLELELPQRCVLVGRNGAGKSTMLGALAIAISHAMRETAAFDFFWSLVSSDIRVGATHAAVILEINGQVYASTIERGRSAQMKGQSLQPSRPLPAFVFLRADRGMHGHTLQALKALGSLRIPPFPSQYQPELEAWWGAMRVGPLVFSEVVPWMTREENIENEVRLGGQPEYRVRNLQVVRAALSGFLKSLGDAPYSNPRITRAAIDGLPEIKEGTLAFDKNGEKMLLPQLSDGEQVMLLAVADIARRLAIANPEAEDALHGSGIVLIDEVELHMHPGWQRHVLPALFATFPNMQFICTTHSPQVLGSLTHDQIILLEDFQARPCPAPTRGRDSNALLREVLGAEERAPDVLAELQALSELIDGDRLDEARDLLDDLREQLSERDGELVRLGALLDFLDPEA